MNIPSMWKAKGSKGKFKWTSEMENEYKAVLKIMKTQTQPIQPEKVQNSKLQFNTTTYQR